MPVILAGEKPAHDFLSLHTGGGSSSPVQHSTQGTVVGEAPAMAANSGRKCGISAPLLTYAISLQLQDTIWGCTLR